MRKPHQAAITIVMLGLCAAWAQDRASNAEARVSSASEPIPGQAEKPASSRAKRHRKITLNKDDRSAVVEAALEAKRHRYHERDCSHLVHAIYEHAGFPYPYAPSDGLYSGAQGFERVTRPQPADLVVWHGHVGIVIHPSQHAFLSFLSRGPAVDDYRSRYWKGRGEPRFYRYVKNDACPGCTLARGNGE
jgi:cell wall-associated NlpC family hydrolase